MSAVESRTGAVSTLRSLRFPSPLVKPDVQISRIRLSDRLHLRPQHPTPSEDVEIGIATAIGLVSPAQEAVHAMPDVMLEVPIGPRARPIGEVRRPTAYETVQLVAYRLPWRHVAWPQKPAHRSLAPLHAP